MLFLLLSAQIVLGAPSVVVRSQEVDLPSTPGPKELAQEIWHFTWAVERMYRQEGAQTIFDTTITRDKNGFRSVADTESKKQLRYHLFIAGCSFTFGEGLNDADTFPAMLSPRLPETRVVNMGAPGVGVSEHLYLWRNFNWNQRYPEQEGLLLYSMIEDHFERLARNWRYLDWARDSIPYYEQRDGKLVYTGILRETTGYRWAQFIKKLGISEWWLRGASHFTPYILKDSVPNMIAHLTELRAAYLQQFPKGRFIVTWRPYFPPWTSDERKKEILDALTEAKIEFWDHTPDWPYFQSTGGQNGRIIIGDGHTNAFSNREYTEHLSRQIKSTTSRPAL